MPEPQSSYSVVRDGPHVALEINGSRFILSAADAEFIARRLSQIAADIAASNPPGARKPRGAR